MNFKGVIDKLAGPGSIGAILLLVLLIALAGTPRLQQNRVVSRHIGFELALTRAQAIADALLANSTEQPLNSMGTSYRAHHLRNAMTSGGSTQPLAESPAVKRMRADPRHIGVHFERSGNSYWLHYAVPDGRGGVLLLDVSLAKEQSIVTRFFGQSYLSAATISYLLIGLLLCAAAGLRHFLRRLAALPLEERRELIEASLADSDGSARRNLLPWLIALCGLVFFVDVRDWLDSAVGIGYLLAVTLGLSSNRHWHSTVVAGLGVMLLFIAPLFSPPDLTWIRYIENHAFTTFAIIVTGLLGSANTRKTRAEALAYTEAARSRHENAALKQALERAEAAEEQRREIIERMRMANQTAGISQWEWDLTNDLATFTEDSAMGERLGRKRQYRPEDYIAQFVHSDYVASCRAAFESVLKGSERCDGRYRVNTANGQLLYLQFHGQLIRAADGSPLRVIGVDWEVTEEVATTRELQRQAQHLRDIEARLERSSVFSLDGHWEADIVNSNECCWFSSSFATLTGYDPAYLATLNTAAMLDLVHPDDRPRQRAAWTAHIATGAAYDVRLRLRVANGEYRWFQLRGAAERDAAEKWRRVAGSIRDVHQQKIAEDLLHETQLRFERAVSGTQDALFDCDLRNGSMWRSPRYYEMLGYDPGELGDSELSVAKLIHIDDAPQIGKVAAAHLQNNAPYDVEYRMRHRDGRWIWVRERAKADRDENGKPIRLAGSIHDITEQRFARDTMIAATAEAEAASRAKSTFLATMSHEIRTPMNGVIGMTGLLLDTPLDRVQRDYAETIRASADSLLTILNDILDFSKIEAGKLDIDCIEIDLNTNVDDVGSILAFQAAAKGLELVVNVRPEVPQRVLGDPQRIRQCLLNLVGNAIKFTQSGEVVLEVCSLGQQDGCSLVHFEVRDTGIGIDPETIQKLFQPFTQADSSTTRKFGGTGLGLSIVRKLVELMGGQTGAQSQPGKGSTFWFTLPLETAINAEDKLAPATVAFGKRVLLVDDNETNRRVLANQMIHAGYWVESAASADQALSVLRQQKVAFDVVVLDYHMPDIDGAMLGERIMKATDIAPTRLMLLTSLDRSGDMQRFADIGFSAYLTKPVRTRELLDCLDKTLSRNAEDWHLRSQPIITRGTLIAGEGRRQYTGKVLLVEDNPINQRVARRYLERLGCEVQVVDDGAQAVAAFQQQTFGFILMDMQMPVMDGIEATRRIREIERAGARTPIVALTANAMMGTLERCLEAGMDDYLTKPLDISRLRDVLDRFFGSDAPVPMNAAVSQSQVEQLLAQSAPSPELDPAVRARLSDIAGDDNEFAGELVTAFVMGGEQSIREMRAATIAQDRDALGRAAHKLKGASANLHIDRLAALAGDAEACAKAGKDGGTAEVLEEIVSEFTRIVSALQRDIEHRPRHAAAS